MSQIPVNNCYLVNIVLLISLTTAGFGIALVQTDELSNTYKMRLKWTDSEQEDNITWLTCASALGLMIGSLASSSIVKIGRRKSIMLACIVALVGALMQFVWSFWMLIAGKIVYGASSGVMLTGGALYLTETLPESKIGSHGFAVNLGITFGLTVVLIMGMTVSDDDPDSLSYLYVAFIPIVVAVANFLLWLICFKNEPINFCIANAN